MRVFHWRAAAMASLVAFVAPIGATGAAAQEPEHDPFLNLGSYAIAIPLGDTHRFTPGMSWFGLGWDPAWIVRPRTVVGASVTLNDFYDQTHGTTNFSSGSATGLQARDLLIVSAMGTGRWYVNRLANRGPYIGLGAGGQVVQQSYQLGVNSQFSRTGFHLLLAPEVGVATPVMDGSALVISARYVSPTSAGNYVGGGSRRFGFLMLSFGMIEQ